MTKNEFKEQKRQILGSQLRYWQLSTQQLEKDIQEVPTEKLPVAVQAYGTAANRVLEVLDLQTRSIKKRATNLKAPLSIRGKRGFQVGGDVPAGAVVK
jgi:hypothetical protein